MRRRARYILLLGDADLHAAAETGSAAGGAADASRRLGAEAFTVGNHIHFARRGFTPRSGPGRELLAHELAHVVQQTAPSAAEAGLTPSTRLCPMRRPYPGHQAFQIADGTDEAPFFGNGDAAFFDTVRAALDQIGGHASGSRLISSIEAVASRHAYNKQVFVFPRLGDGSTSSDVSRRNIMFEHTVPGTEGLTNSVVFHSDTRIADVSEDWNRDVQPFVYLAHELVHSYHHLSDSEIAEPDEEWRATGLRNFATEPFSENRLRCECGSPPRTYYYTDGEGAADIQAYHDAGYLDPQCTDAGYFHPRRPPEEFGFA